MPASVDAYVRIWRFRVREDRIGAFHAAYGPAGHWGRLFSRSPDYRGTELLHSPDEPLVFITIDRWTNRAAWERFRRLHAAEYLALDQACEALTSEESEVGDFDLLRE